MEIVVGEKMNLTPLIDPTGTRSMLVSILAEKHPLTAKQIFYAIKKERISITYQAVHKLLKHMVEDETLKRTDSQYELEIRWIQKMREFSERAAKLYEKKMDLHDYDFSEPIEVEFKDQYNMGIFLRDVFDRYAQLKNKNEKIMCYCLWSFVYFPLPYDYKNTKNIMSKFYYKIISNHRTKIEEWIKKIWENSGGEVHYKDLGSPPVTDYFVIDDIVVGISWSIEFLKFLTEYYKEKDVNDLDIEDLFSIIQKKHVEIRFSVKKNKHLANEIRERIEGMIKG